MIAPVGADAVATGRTTGLALPSHPEALRAAGADFLTDAFRAYGTLAADNRVTAITRFERFAGGNSGLKAVLSVTYDKPAAGLDTELFVKFSRDFTDAFRDRRRFELDGEIRLAELSRHPAFPVAVPRPYFADIDPVTGSGLLVTQRIAFGSGRIEPLHPKCMDRHLTDPFEYYAQTISSLAHLAGAEKAGRLSPDLERLFPFDARAAAADLPIAADAAAMRDKVAGWRQLIERCPQLFPANLRGADWFARMERDALALLESEADLRHFLHADPDLIALCHWNTNIDNAWFWREDDGSLRCGLLDWGMVRQMNLGYGLWGGLSAADGPFLKRELPRLLALFAAELEASGGPRLDLARLSLHFDLSVALLGLALMMDTPALVLARLASIGDMTGPHDPRLEADKVVHGFLHVSTNFLDLWESRDFGGALLRMA